MEEMSNYLFSVDSISQIGDNGGVLSLIFLRLWLRFLSLSHPCMEWPFEGHEPRLIDKKKKRIRKNSNHVFFFNVWAGSFLIFYVCTRIQENLSLVVLKRLLSLLIHRGVQIQPVTHSIVRWRHGHIPKLSAGRGLSPEIFHGLYCFSLFGSTINLLFIGRGCCTLHRSVSGSPFSLSSHSCASEISVLLIWIIEIIRQVSSLIQVILFHGLITLL